MLIMSNSNQTGGLHLSQLLSGRLRAKDVELSLTPASKSSAHCLQPAEGVRQCTEILQQLLCLWTRRPASLGISLADIQLLLLQEPSNTLD